jgi:CRISPR/Cas system CMR-associated protein Cmr3 (group 5 of RAMP superfamily)
VTGFWATFVGVVGALATLVAAFQGIKIVLRGRRTTFYANIWKRLAEVEAALEREKTAREKETAALRAALQQFRQRDGIWLELWHDSNVERVANGMTAVQLPDKLRKWPDEIQSIM